MKKDVRRYCPMCKKVETQSECSYGPKIWDMMAMKRKLVSEASRKEKIANAVLGATFALSAAQSPKDFIRTGHIESPGAASMQRWARVRGEAERNLDSGRVSYPARNRKKKPVSEPVSEASNLDKKTLMMMIIKKMIDEKKRKNYLLNYGYIGEAKTAAWQRKEGKNPEGGLNRKGIASYRRENPGSKLSMAVTTKPSKLKKGSKSWKRRRSFCARMSGMPGPMRDEKGRPTRKALSLRKWNC